MSELQSEGIRKSKSFAISSFIWNRFFSIIKRKKFIQQIEIFDVLVRSTSRLDIRDKNGKQIFNDSYYEWVKIQNTDSHVDPELKYKDFESKMFE